MTATSRPFKTILSVLLVLVLIIGLTPYSAFAEEGTLSSGSDHNTSITGKNEANQAESNAERELGDSETQALEDNALSSPPQTSETFSKETKALQVIDEKAGIDYVENEVIVVFKEEVSESKAEEVLARNDSVVEQTISAENIVDEEVVVAEIVPEKTVSEAIEEISQDTDVAYVQPNYIYQFFEDEVAGEDIFTQAAATINDPNKGYQWSLEATRMYDAWGLARTDQKVGVAVIDTGVLMTHSDLKDNIPNGFYYDATKTGRTGDSHGHGTHVSGIISARTNNGIGISGSSYNANIFPFCIQDSSGGMNTASIIEAYRYLLDDADKNGRTFAEENNIKVVNLSMGTKSKDAAMKGSIDKALSKGILTVAASGNVGAGGITKNDLVYPAAFSSCLSVASLQKNGNGAFNVSVAPNSVSNAEVDIAAPGASIYSTTRNGGYGYMSGTSMATPYVSGVAALLFASNPNATPASVRSAIEGSAYDLDPKGTDIYSGKGAIDSYKAIIALSKTTLSCPSYVKPNTPTQCQVSSTLVLANTWKWSVVSGPATITQGGILTTTGKGTVVVRAQFASDANVFAEATVQSESLTDIASASISLATSVIYTGSACTPRPTVKVGTTTLALDRDYTLSYKNNVNIGTATITITGKGNYTGILTQKFKIIKMSDRVDLSAKAHIQNIGDRSYPTVTGATVIGTTGQSLRLEALTLSLKNAPISGGLTYSSHIQNIGWQSPVTSGNESGTRARSLRLEAITINLTGEMSKYYDIHYRTHVQNIGWTGWAKNGQQCGSAGLSYRMEAVEIVIVKKNVPSLAPGIFFGGIVTNPGTPRMFNAS